MMHGPIFTFLYWVVRFGLFFYHPIFKVVGRKGVPKTGRVLFCCNHSGLADPVWLVMAAAITVGEWRLPVSFWTISTGRVPPCSLPTTGLRSA